MAIPQGNKKNTKDVTKKGVTVATSNPLGKGRS